jgi:hypothetical protein
LRDYDLFDVSSMIPVAVLSEILAEILM